MVKQIERLKDIDIINLEKHNIKIIKYKQNGVDTIVKNVDAYSLHEVTGNEKHKNIFFVEYDDKYNNEFWFYDNFNFASRFIGDINIMKEFDIFINQLDKYIDNNGGYKNFKNGMIEIMNNNQFISNEVITIFELAGESQDFIQQLKDYRINFYKLKEEKEKQEREEKNKKEQEILQNKKNEINNLIQEAENKILQGEKIVNNNITIINNNNEEIETSLILHLMKENNIEIPLKTQGWINKALYSIFTGEDNIYTYNYYNSSKNSTVFQKYLMELIEVIKNKNNIALSTEEIETKQAEQEKQEYKNNIKDIDFKKEYNIFRIEMDINILKKKNGSHDFNLEEQETLVKRIFKALKYENIESKTKEYFLFESLSNRELKNRITLSKNNINISVIGIKDNDKIKLYFKKWYDNKDDVYVSIETL